MKKSVLFISLFLPVFLFPAFGMRRQAASKSETPPATVQRVQQKLEIKGGYFFFSDGKMRRIYDEGGLDLQLSGSVPAWRWLQIYGSVEYLARHGRTLNSGFKTRIWEVPLSFGLQPVVRISRIVQYYVTLGPRYFIVHVHNDSPFLQRDVSQNGWGGFVNTGFHFFPIRHLLIDVFGEYSYKRMQFYPSKTNVFGREIQVGGFTFGMGLGYAF